MAPTSRAPDETAEAVNYQVRIDLNGAKPPIWRRLVVAPELTLDKLHIVLQVAMGWEDVHLHQFVSGNIGDRDAERYIPDAMAEDDFDSPLEKTVRLDEVLVEPRDKLTYWYDFGDDWVHTLVLERVAPRVADELPAVVIGGDRACPPEDTIYTPEFDPGRFSVEETNTRLHDLADLLRSK